MVKAQLFEKTIDNRRKKSTAWLIGAGLVLFFVACIKVLALALAGVLIVLGLLFGRSVDFASRALKLIEADIRKENGL
ncbi:MAG: hypothetical protein GY874_17305 [Desulfobacteraceae bacterium]|nr:hypothetical protein [Desulfobacteraceae bacterium]